MIRKFTRALGAFAILGMLSTSIASADQALTVAATTPATTAASTSTVAPAADSNASSDDLAQAGPLSDVPLNSWAYDAVDQLAKDGIIKGYPDGTYKGARPMTRYEAAVLAYRAVDMIEAQITANKAVAKADIDAANKLLAAFGAQLKAVQAHVDALQKQADATDASLNTTNRVVAGQAAQIGALNDFNRRAQIHVTDIFRSFAYGQNVQANCGSFAYAANPAGAAANGVQTYCANTGGGNALLQGVKTGGYQPVWGNNPPSGNFANGAHNQGQGFNYFKITFSGNPSPNVAFLVELSDSARMATGTGTSTQTTDCIPTQNYLNGNAGQAATLTNCSIVNAAQAAYNDGETGFNPGFNNLWVQTQIPTSGIYLRMGHVQNNEGPTGGSWLGGDYYYGAMIGITKGPLNGYVGFGYGNAAATNQTLLNVPNTAQTFTVEADYTLKLGAGAVNVGGMYNNYTGENSLMWDPSAIACVGTTPIVAGVGTAGQTKFFANTAAVPFAGCGAGFTPLTRVGGAPVTGYYLSAQNNNPTITGTLVPGVTTASLTAPVGSFTTPGLVVNNPIGMLGGHLIFTYGKARLYLAGTTHLGNDPYTGAAWAQGLTGNFVFDYGPFRGGVGNAGKWTFRAEGFTVGFNGGLPNVNDFGGPVLDNSWTTNWNGLYWLHTAVRYWLADFTQVSLGFGHAGQNAGQLLPASNAACPGCVVSGYSQNAAYLEFNMNF